MNVFQGVACVAISTAMIAPGAAVAVQTSTLAIRTAVSAVLDDSAKGWNTGDLDRFMACYDHGASTTYVSGGKVNIGFEAIRATYRTRFASRPDAMGKLTLSILNLRLVGADHAYVVGRFVLHRPGSAGDVEGLTTLLFRRTGAGWRIIADHS
jgi:uncharacterized protein (TIGR02246 family)